MIYVSLTMPVLCLLLPLLAAQDPPDTPPADTPAPKPSMKAPLVAEGTLITDVKGEMVRDGHSPLWRFRVDAKPGDTPGQTREFVLLPCHLLEEMEQKANALAPQPAKFSLSGEILNYGRNNWLLPQHVEWITTHAQRNESEDVPADPSNPDPESGDAADSPTDPSPTELDSDPAPEDSEDPWGDDAPGQRDQGDSIADIVAGLQQSVGPLRRSVDTGGTAVPMTGPKEGQLLVSRRGRLGRGPTGAWLFVLDSDVTGLSDPSLVLLPSQRTAELEVYGGYGWLGQPMLVSGEVFTYRGRHFLRPTAWKIVRERPNLIR
ncbi:MAG: hypothetical protein VX527_12720 [Planctomycetota bacterium]|nr:hypothetical protein [Planctomycetota bacterium]